MSKNAKATCPRVIALMPFVFNTISKEDTWQPVVGDLFVHLVLIEQSMWNKKTQGVQNSLVLYGTISLGECRIEDR